MSSTSRNLALGAVLALSLGLVSLAVISASHPRETEPSFEGKPLRYWINAEPEGTVTYDGTVSLRTRALRAMGERAVKYLRWMLQHPSLQLRRPLERIRPLAMVVQAAPLLTNQSGT